MNTFEENSSAIIIPQWPIPDSVKSILTTRNNGFSKSPFESFNLASHVHDNANSVQLNRDKLNQILPIPALWLNQTHSSNIYEFDQLYFQQQQNLVVDGDGMFSLKSNQPCSVLTADCLPLLFCSEDGSTVAAIHAGWRGLIKGIIDQCVNILCTKSKLPAKNLLVWLGPAISKQHFEVGTEVKDQFLNKNPDFKVAFDCKVNIASKNKSYLADIYQLAKINLQQLGVEKIYGASFCTYSDQDRFFSYRRDGITGRMASIIWKTSQINTIA